jgi:hypothetical protein
MFIGRGAARYRKEDISHLNVQNGFGAQQVAYPMGTRVPFSGSIAADLGVDHLHLVSRFKMHVVVPPITVRVVM